MQHYIASSTYLLPPDERKDQVIILSHIFKTYLSSESSAHVTIRLGSLFQIAHLIEELWASIITSGCSDLLLPRLKILMHLSLHPVSSLSPLYNKK